MTLTANERRPLGFWMCTALVVGNTIGIGIFLMPAALAPYGINAVSGWVVTVVGCTFLACVFAGLARTFPQDDGPYAYTRRAFGDGVTFIALWCYWVATCVTNAAIAIGIVGYVSVFAPSLATVAWMPPAVALSFLWFSILVNLLGVRTVGWVQVLLTALKLTPHVAIVMLGLWVLFTHAEAYTAHPPPNPASLREVIAASTIALFSMLGIECATVPATKVLDPARTIPRATIAGAIATGLIYLCVSVIPMLLIPQAELGASNAPFADLFMRQIGAGYAGLLAVFIIISGIGALNGWTLMIGELTQSFARHGSFPPAFGNVNARGAPALALVVTGALASVMLLANYNESMASGFAFLSVVVTAANLPMYLACSLAVLVLWRRGEIRRPRGREFLWFAAALIAAAYCVWVFVGVGAKSLLWALALGLLGIPVYWLSPAFRRRRSADAGTSRIEQPHTRESA